MSLKNFIVWLHKSILCLVFEGPSDNKKKKRIKNAQRDLEDGGEKSHAVVVLLLGRDQLLKYAQYPFERFATCDARLQFQVCLRCFASESMREGEGVKKVRGTLKNYELQRYKRR